MSELREAYLQKKRKENELLTEAFAKWLDKNVIIITEGIDARTVKKLVSKIQKFDDRFGPYKSKIPTIAAMIDNAELGLQKVLTGKVNDKKASDMLKRLTYLYSSFSKFFSKDLEILMMSHLFRAPKDNPDVRMDVLTPPPDVNYDPAAIRDTLRNALEPSKEEMKLIKKIHRSKNMPFIDSLSIANEMIKMSFNELKELAGGEQVPMVATPDSTEEADLSAPEEAPAAADQETGLDLGLPNKESVDRTKKKDSELIKESHVLLVEMNQKDVSTMVDTLTKLNSSFNIPGLEDINLQFKDLTSKARQEIAQNKWTTGKSVKQLVTFYNLLDNLKQQWPDIKKMFANNPDGKLDDQEKQDLQKLLVAATKDNVFQSLAKAFKMSTPHATGLDPNSLVTGIMGAVDQEGGLQALEALFTRTSSLPDVEKDGSPRTAANTIGSKAKGDVVSGVQGAQQQQKAAQVNPGLDPKAIGQKVVQTLSMSNGEEENISKVVNFLRRAGYEVAPKK